MCKFSVIVPAYNCAGTLENTVKSILSSGLADFELIIIDDGSKDETGMLCDKLAGEYGQIRCIHQENAGVSSARNRGIDEAEGKYILFFDCDDSVDADAFQDIDGMIDNAQPDMLIFGESFDYCFKGRMYRRDELVYGREGCLDSTEVCKSFEELYSCNALSPVWNKFIKRSMITENSIRFDGDIFEMEDFLFSVKCLAHCESVYMLPKAIYRYRQAEDERGTYNRLCRVRSLTEYMIPFENAAEEAAAVFADHGARFESGGRVVEKIYAMLFHEQIRFAGIERIKNAASDMLGGRYAEVIRKTYPGLFDDMQNGRFGRIYMRNLKARLRHYAAVRYKYLRSLLKR